MCALAGRKEKPKRAGVTVLNSNGFLHVYAVGDIGLFNVVVRVIHPPESFGIQVYKRAGGKITHNAKAEHLLWISSSSCSGLGVGDGLLTKALISMWMLDDQW